MTNSILIDSNCCGFLQLLRLPGQPNERFLINYYSIVKQVLL